MSLISKSWQAFSPEVADKYLNGFGNPSESSKELLLNILRSNNANKVLDLGCGNGQLHAYFKSNGLKCKYTGVDFSEPLLKSARERHHEAEFISDDIHVLSKINAKQFDFVIYSHVLEMLESPQASLSQAKTLAKKVIVRFFEPPESDIDKVELREMDVGLGKVPYIRRTMSKKYYQLILNEVGCKRVDVYRDITKDQVHVMYF